MLALALTIIGGVALAIALLIGAANPPHVTNLVFNATNTNSFTDRRQFGKGISLKFPLNLTPPFTIEIEAGNSGATLSGWGLAASDSNGAQTTYPLMIDNSGYVVTGADDDSFQHFEFPPIRLNGFNALTLDASADGFFTFRVNDEFFQSALLDDKQVYTLSLLLYGEPKLDWKSIKAYTS